MPPTESTASPAAERPGEAAAREQAAAAMVTSVVDKFTKLTTKWLDESASALTTSFEKALAPGYTADQLAKDVAGMWARNLEYLGSLVTIAVPDKPSTTPGPEPEEQQG